MNLSIIQTGKGVGSTFARSNHSKGHLLMAYIDLTPRPYATQLEIWRPVVGYEGYYEVSNLGRIKRVAAGGRNAKIGRILKLIISNYGYARIVLQKNHQREYLSVHRLVAEAFLGQPPTADHVINHINSIKDDNRVENLEWCTQSENIKHAYRVGFASQKGERNNATKLTWALVRQIRAFYAQGYTIKELAITYEVSWACISMIVKNKNWKEG